MSQSVRVLRFLAECNETHLGVYRGRMSLLERTDGSLRIASAAPTLRDVIDRAERGARTAAAIAALEAMVMAVEGLIRARRRPKGPAVGTTYSELPRALFAVGGIGYTIMVVKAWRPLPTLPGPLRWLCLTAGAGLYAAGMGFIFGGRLTLGEMYDLSTTRGAGLYADHRLVTTGPFKLVRHPMYFGAVLGAVGALLLYRTWTMVLLCLHLPVFFVRARREEQVLETAFGDEWRAYRARVPAGVPVLGRSRVEARAER